MDLLTVWDTVKRIGFKKTAAVVSFLFWLLLSLFIWYQLYLRFPTLFSTNPIFIFVAVFAAIGAFFLISTYYSLKRYGFGLIKKMGWSQEIFQNPSAADAVSKFKQESRKLVIPFSQQEPIALAFLSSMRSTSKIFLVSIAGNLIASYSIIVVIVRYKLQLTSAFSPYVSKLYSYFSPLPSIVHGSLTYPLITILFMWIFSLYYNRVLLKYLANPREVRAQRSTFGILHIIGFFDIYTKLSLIPLAMIDGLVDISDHGREFRPVPFVDPITLPLIIKKCVEKAEGGESCSISLCRDPQLTEDEMMNAKKAFIQDRRIPVFLRMFMQASKPSELLEWLKAHEIMAYTAIRKERCVFLGYVYYDPLEKVRKGNFFFDTTYLKKEFVKVYKKHEQKQSEIETELPNELPENFALDVIEFDRD